MPLQLEKGDKVPISEITINAFKNNFDKSGNSSYGRVRSNSRRVTITNLAAVISDRHVGIEPGMISYVARLLHEETMRQLKMGRNVEALGLGTLYVGTKGRIKGDKPSLSDLPKFVIKFRNAKETIKALENIKAGDVSAIENKPIISIIEDMVTKAQNTELKKGTVVRLKGKKLKIEGDKPTCGLYLYKEGGTFEKVDAGNIIRNEPSCIEFILPSTVQVGSLYSIKVRNQGKTRKGFTKAVREGSAGTLVKIIV